MIPTLSLGALRGKLVKIGRDAAMIERSSNGARLRHTRRLGSQEWSVPWFEFHEEGMQ